MAKKLLITGGKGFIARNLFEQLCHDFEVIACNHSELDLLDSNKVLDLIKNGRFDVVIHAATHDPAPKYSIKDPAKVLENNLRMFFNVARCNDHYGKLLYFGSGAEFGRENWRLKMDEGYYDQHVPTEQYGFSKYVMTKHALQSKNIYNLRVFSVFGKYEDWRYRFISRACCSALFDLPIMIRQNTYYDYLYINDLVAIVRWFVNNSPLQQVYNVCSGLEIKAAELAKIVKKIAGKDIEIIDNSDSPCREYSGNNMQLLKELEKFRFTPLDEAILDLYNWYSANKQIINKEELL
ncbi:MAG: NAD(P)-dependent oxidoreductase [Candidatus Margulisiibacteriota bacterium]